MIITPSISNSSLYSLAKCLCSTVEDHVQAITPFMRGRFDDHWWPQLQQLVVLFCQGVEKQIREQAETQAARTPLNTHLRQVQLWRMAMSAVARQASPEERDLLLLAVGRKLGSPRSYRELEDFLREVVARVDSCRSAFVQLGVTQEVLAQPEAMLQAVLSRQQLVSRERAEDRLQQTDLKQLRTGLIDLVNGIHNAAKAGEGMAQLQGQQTSAFRELLIHLQVAVETNVKQKRRSTAKSKSDNTRFSIQDFRRKGNQKKLQTPDRSSEDTPPALARHPPATGTPDTPGKAARNVEIKARLPGRQQVEAVVRQLAQGGPELLAQTDVFFAAPRGRLKLRQLGSGQAQLIQYQRADQSGPATSSYHLAEITDPAALRLALAAALGERAVVTKQRTLYLIGRTRVHLDQVEGLGDFLELEVVLRPDESSASGVAEAKQLMRKLGVQDQHLVETAYVDLLAS